MEQVTLGARPNACAVNVERYLGWEAIRLSNGIVDLIAVPEIGGRILQLKLGGEEYFYVNPRHAGRVYPPEENNLAAGWKNYGGSKVWPAPQGWSSDCEWPGPPDPVLDGGNYAWEILDGGSNEAVLSLASPADQYTGLVMLREIRVLAGAATVQIRHRMRNASIRPVRWALWQVTQQMASPSFAIWVPAKGFRQTLGDEAYDAITTDLRRGVLKLEYANHVAKFTVNAEAGWICTVDSARNIVLAERFQIFRGMPYVDDAPMAIWVNGSGSYTVHSDRILCQDDPNGCDAYVETEIFSPLVDLNPGEGYGFETSWHCARLAGDSVQGMNQCAIIGRGLDIHREGDSLRVTTLLGVFRSGTLELASICKNGGVISTQVLGPATPLHPAGLTPAFRSRKAFTALAFACEPNRENCWVLSPKHC
jgi:Domain of unknown function (DUF4380)